MGYTSQLAVPEWLHAALCCCCAHARTATIINDSHCCVLRRSWSRGKNDDDYHLDFDTWWRRDLAAMVLRDRNHPSVIIWCALIADR